VPQFLKVKTAEEVLEILEQIEPLETEVVDLNSACGRVLSANAPAAEPVPHFNRATMDGYAVRAGDTFGASEALPAFLEIAGEVSMGETAAMSVGRGQAVAVPTGGMLPAGADAVVMVEYTSNLDEKTIEVTKPVAPGDNVLQIGEDIREGETLFDIGWRLRPQDIGILAALGVTAVSVYRRPRAAIISTGDEIVPAETDRVPPGKIRDINSFTLSSQIREAGGVVGMREVVVDRLDLLVSACLEALENHDVLLLSGGSSVGVRDYTLDILEHIPNANLLVHGIAVRPGKPTILARVGRKLFWGLPGQPVSAMMIFRAFVIPSLSFLQGQRKTGDAAGAAVRATLNRRLPSVQGRTDYIPVIVSSEEGAFLATPIFGKSSMIGILARADGYVIIPERVEGLEEGTEVVVNLFSQ